MSDRFPVFGYGNEEGLGMKWEGYIFFHLNLTNPSNVDDNWKDIVSPLILRYSPPLFLPFFFPSLFFPLLDTQFRLYTFDPLKILFFWAELISSVQFRQFSSS